MPPYPTSEQLEWPFSCQRYSPSSHLPTQKEESLCLCLCLWEAPKEGLKQKQKQKEAMDEVVVQLIWQTKIDDDDGVVDVVVS